MRTVTFLLNDMLHRLWNLLNQWFEKRKLWLGFISSSICFPLPTNHHLFTGFSWYLIVIHSLYRFSSIDSCAAWRPRLPDQTFVLRAWFSAFVKPKFYPKKTKMLLRHRHVQKTCYYWDSISKYEYEAWNAMWTKNLE